MPALQKSPLRQSILYNIAKQGDDQQGLVIMDRHKGMFGDLLMSNDSPIFDTGRSQVK